MPFYGFSPKFPDEGSLGHFFAAGPEYEDRAYFISFIRSGDNGV